VVDATFRLGSPGRGMRKSSLSPFCEKKVPVTFLEGKMKKILTLSIALILVAGILSLAKSADIDTDTGGPSTAYPKDRHIVKTSTGVVVIYWRAFSPNTGIRGKKSTDNGATWTNLGNGSGSTLIGSGSGSGNDFSICLDSSTNNIYVAYKESNDIYFKKLTYSVSAGTWTPGVQQSVEDLDNNDTAHPSITRESDGDIWVSYGYYEAGGKVRSRYSTDEFQSSKVIRDVTSSHSGSYEDNYWSALVIRNGNPFIVYADMHESRYKWSYWTGTSWASTGTITDTDLPNSGDDFSITMMGSDVHFVYNQSAAGIKHRYYNGTSWSDPATTLSASTSDKNVNLATDGTNLWCFISQYVAANSYNIKYKKRSGGTWDGSWTAVTTDDADNIYSTTPPSTTEYIPLAWTKGTNPATVTVKFSSSVVIGDTTSPAAISDLSGQCDSQTGDVKLYWSTPGDDGWNNTLPSQSGYRIDYSTYSKQWNKDNYQVWIPTSGVAPHTQVSRTITGLTGATTWYFQIWTRDEVPNWSGLSNGATVWVNPVLSITIEPSVRPFGEVPANQSDVLSDGFTVTNTGNVTQKYQLRLTGVPTGWTAKNVAGAPGWEEVKILGLFTTQSPLSASHFDDNPPNTGDGDIVRSTSNDTATSTNFAISTEGAGVKGYDVTVSGIRYLWFRFDAPSGTSIKNEQFLTVTVTAIQQ